jgi:hypothetical protein
MRRRLLVAALVAAGALPAAAHANTYCVDTTPECNNDNLALALFAASQNPGPDRVEIGAGDYEAAGGFHYAAGPDNPVEIVGEGDATILRGKSLDPGGSTTLELAGAGSSVRKLAIELPTDDSSYGLTVTHATAEDVTVRRMASGGVGIVAESATLQRVDVDGGKVGVLVAEGTIESSRISGVIGVRVLTGAMAATIRRSHVEGNDIALQAFVSRVAVSDSVLVGGYGGGAEAHDQGSSTPTEVDATHVTLVTRGGATGATATSLGPGGATVRLRNSIVAGFDAGVSRAEIAPGHAEVVVDHSVLPPGPPVAGMDETSILRLADPGFTDTEAGDYTLAAGSPALDAGAVLAGSGAVDILGRPRVADGDANGSALPDPGAFERPAPAPSGGGGGDGGGGPVPGGGDAGPAVDTRAPAIAGLRVRHRRVRFALDEAARVTVKVSRRGKVVRRVQRDAAAGTVTVRLRRRAIRLPGRYRVTVRAVDAAGNAALPVRAAFRVT